MKQNQEKIVCIQDKCVDVNNAKCEEEFNELGDIIECEVLKDDKEKE